MKRTEEICRLFSIVCGMAFVWRIAAELQVLPYLVESDLLRWQVMLVAGVFLWVFADRLSDLRCRCCGSSHVLLRGLLSPSHELLCRTCLSWNPSPEPAPAPAEQRVAP